MASAYLLWMPDDDMLNRMVPHHEAVTIILI